MGFTPQKNNSIRWWAQEETDETILHFFRLPIAGAASIPGIDLDFPRNLTLSQWVDKMMTTGTLFLVILFQKILLLLTGKI